jgi:hypothetical protein
MLAINGNYNRKDGRKCEKYCRYVIDDKIIERIDEK